MSNFPQFGSAQGLQQPWKASGGDVTINCGSKQFRVHKFVLQLQQGLFATAIQQGKFKEGQSQVINLDAADEDVIEGVLRYLYDLEYECSDDTSGCLHARMYVAGEFYSYPKLKANAHVLLSRYLDNIKNEDANEFLKVARIVYDGSPDTLEEKDTRAKLTRVCRGFMMSRGGDEDFVEELHGVAGLAKDLIKMQSTNSVSFAPLPDSIVRCLRCGIRFAVPRGRPVVCPNSGPSRNLCPAPITCSL